MNLHKVVRGLVTTVNSDIQATLYVSSGYSTDAAGKRVPGYATPMIAKIQVQGLSGPDLLHLNSTNAVGDLTIQGVVRSVYLYGNWNGIVRVDSKGGDKMTFPEFPGGPLRTWLIVTVMESWPDWTRVIVSLQLS